MLGDNFTFFSDGRAVHPVSARSRSNVASFAMVGVAALLRFLPATFMGVDCSRSSTAIFRESRTVTKKAVVSQLWPGDLIPEENDPVERSVIVLIFTCTMTSINPPRQARSGGMGA